MAIYFNKIYVKQTLLFWSVILFVIPISLFILSVLFISNSPSELTQIKEAQIWIEPLGNRVFSQNNLDQLLLTQPDFTKATWKKISLPYTKELGASIDLPANASKARAWIKLTVPPSFKTQDIYHRIGILSNRIMAGGPWSVWMNEQLVMANAPDWRVQWNIPMKAMLPVLNRGNNEVIISFPYAQVQGFAIGSVYLGALDAINYEWGVRHFYNIEISRISSIIALILLALSLQLTLGRPKEPIFGLLSVCALIWSVSNLQYIYDLTDQPALSYWFFAAVDISINWWVIFQLLFAFEFEKINMPRFKKTLLLYGCASTIITLPLWDWEKNALMAQHIINFIVFVVGVSLFAIHVYRHPRREGIAIFIGLVFQILTAIHTLFYVANQTHPDHFITYPIGCITLFAVFLYVINRRTVMALNTAEVHQQELEHQLNQQKIELATQHKKMQELEITYHLAQQKETLMQDLHDGIGSNLTSAIMYARSGTLQNNDTLHLLEDLYNDLRNLHKTSGNEIVTLNQILSNLRERIGQRLSQSGIQLTWQVSPNLPALPVRIKGGEHHLRALLNETLANIIKHAQANHIIVKAQAQQQSIVLDIIDNGIGFNYDTVIKGRGLIGMEQRAKTIGAQLTIITKPQQGTHWQLGMTSEEQ